MSVQTIATMVDWIEVNLDKGPTIRKMAEYVGYSQYYCSVKFHQHTGMSYKQYVTGRRLEEAALALQHSDAKVLEIAFRYGFSSNEAFTRAFRKKYQYTPTGFRKEKRKTLQK